MGILTIHKLADKSAGERGVLASGEPAPWPLAGVKIDDQNETTISTRKVAEGVAEGWITLEDVEIVHRPGGPAGYPWGLTHTFQQAGTVVFHTVDGDVRYRVVHQPDKYHVDGDDTPVDDAAYAAGQTRIDWFYGLERDNG